MLRCKHHLPKIVSRSQRRLLTLLLPTIRQFPRNLTQQPADGNAAVQSDSSASADKDSGSSVDKDSDDEEQALLDTALEMTERAQEYWEHSDMEHALDTLDQAYALILKVPAGDPDIAQQKEDLRFVISKRVVEMYAAHQTTVKGTSAAIPMVVNDHVTREIQSFQTIERNFFIESF